MYITRKPAGNPRCHLSIYSCTNMPHDEGLDACREALDTREVLDPPTDDIINLIDLVLKRNNSSFNNTHYLQKHGTAMGTRMAPSYANLFMGRLERDLLQ